MTIILRNGLALIIGVVVGGSVNMGLIILGPSIISPPAGVDVTNTDSISAGMHLFETKHFVFPFLAHALGTLVGAFVAFLIAARHKAKISYIVGVGFLAGGIAASLMIPAPIWFIVLDLVFAYIPMAWVGARFGSLIKKADADVSA